MLSSCLCSARRPFRTDLPAVLFCRERNERILCVWKENHQSSFKQTSLTCDAVSPPQSLSGDQVQCCGSSSSPPTYVLPRGVLWTGGGEHSSECGTPREALCSLVQTVLLAELQDLHVPHVLEKGISFGDHLLQFLNAFPQCQVVLQPTLLDLNKMNHNEAISMVTRRVVGQLGVHASTQMHTHTLETTTRSEVQSAVPSECQYPDGWFPSLCWSSLCVSRPRAADCWFLEAPTLCATKTKRWINSSNSWKKARPQQTRTSLYSSLPSSTYLLISPSKAERTFALCFMALIWPSLKQKKHNNNLLGPNMQAQTGIKDLRLAFSVSLTFSCPSSCFCLLQPSSSCFSCCSFSRATDKGNNCSLASWKGQKHLL